MLNFYQLHIKNDITIGGREAHNTYNTRNLHNTNNARGPSICYLQTNPMFWPPPLILCNNSMPFPKMKRYHYEIQNIYIF